MDSRLVLAISRLRPIADDNLRAVVCDLSDQFRTNPESVVNRLGDYIIATTLLAVIDQAVAQVL